VQAKAGCKVKGAGQGPGLFLRAAQPGSLPTALPHPVFAYAATYRRQLVVGSYFALLLVVGLLCFRDYGVSWDELVDRMNGMVSAKYVLRRLAPGWSSNRPGFAVTPDLHGYRDNDHGVLFELPLVFLNQVSGISDPRTYYLMRHFAVFAVSSVGTWALFSLARIRFRRLGWALLVSTLLVLSPRFFAESFYNGKDIVFLAVFTLGMLTLVRLLQRPTPGRAVLHGLATAAAVDVRILGVLLVAFTLGMLVLEGSFGRGVQVRPLRLVQLALLYGAVTAVATVLGWPFLWEAPVDNFLYVLLRMSRYSAWNGHVLYWGQVLSAQQLPWHYALVWIVITIPVAYTVAFGLGAGSVLCNLLQRPLAYLHRFDNRLDLLFLGWFAGPLVLVIGLNSVLYDGWRHLYFVYPGLLLLAARGAAAVWRWRGHGPGWRRLAWVAASMAGLELATTVVRMWQAHPQEQVYFSFLPPAAAERLFEGDYWGLSYRQGLEWVAAHDTARTLPVAGQNTGLIEKNLSIIKPAVRARFRMVGLGQARYFLTAYRTHPAPYPDSIGQEVYQVRAYGRRVLSVFRRPVRR